MELSDLIGASLTLRRHSGQEGRWTAHLDNCETKEGAVLCSDYGSGTSPEEAMLAYAGRLRGKKIVLNATSAHRQEFNVPDTLNGTGT